MLKGKRGAQVGFTTPIEGYYCVSTAKEGKAWLHASVYDEDPKISQA